MSIFKMIFIMMLYVLSELGQYLCVGLLFVLLGVSAMAVFPMVLTLLSPFVWLCIFGILSTVLVLLTLYIISCILNKGGIL